MIEFIQIIVCLVAVMLRLLWVMAKSLVSPPVIRMETAGRTSQDQYKMGRLSLLLWYAALLHNVDITIGKKADPPC